MATARAPMPPHRATTWERRSLGEGPEEQPERGRQHGGRPAALDEATGDEQVHRRGQAAQGRAEGEDAQADEEQPAAPEAVGAAAGDDEQGGEHDAVAGDDPGQRGRESWGKECSRAGKATFTIERSSEAMKAPRAVTTNTALLWPKGSGAACCLRSIQFYHETYSRAISCIMQSTGLEPWSGTSSGAGARGW